MNERGLRAYEFDVNLCSHSFKERNTFMSPLSPFRMLSSAV
ncbi:hypothetical protein PRIPAC_87274 [Pristionchus pacificus]|nr:hypothetical protein PRIPAC_87274 [Pristionchus pacificus]|eukprot:PDM60565.1 hypothetical protein PRIPAC_53543 [Pristionchus pacificus]